MTNDLEDNKESEDAVEDTDLLKDGIPKEN